MSGGSYNYLYSCTLEELANRRSDLQDMAGRLDELCPEAAAETRSFLTGNNSILDQLEARRARIERLWHAVEWRDSNDWGDSQVAEAIEAYRKQPPAPEILPPEHQTCYQPGAGLSLVYFDADHNAVAVLDQVDVEHLTNFATRRQLRFMAVLLDEATTIVNRALAAKLREDEGHG